MNADWSGDWTFGGQIVVGTAVPARIPNRARQENRQIVFARAWQPKRCARNLQDSTGSRLKLMTCREQSEAGCDQQYGQCNRTQSGRKNPHCRALVTLDQKADSKGRNG
jgi:hypothetical protein